MTSSILDARPQAPSRSPLAAPDYGPLPALLLILTAVTGIVDAVSILSLGRVFVANMTGNVVFAGFAAVGAPGFSLSSSSSRSPSGRLHAPSSLVAQSLRSLAPQSRHRGGPSARGRVGDGRLRQREHRANARQRPARP